MKTGLRYYAVAVGVALCACAAPRTTAPDRDSDRPFLDLGGGELDCASQIVPDPSCPQDGSGPGYYYYDTSPAHDTLLLNLGTGGIPPALLDGPTTCPKVHTIPYPSLFHWYKPGTALDMYEFLSNGTWMMQGGLLAFLNGILSHTARYSWPSGGNGAGSWPVVDPPGGYSIYVASGDAFCILRPPLFGVQLLYLVVYAYNGVILFSPPNGGGGGGTGGNGGGSGGSGSNTSFTIDLDCQIVVGPEEGSVYAYCTPAN